MAPNLIACLHFFIVAVGLKNLYEVINSRDKGFVSLFFKIAIIVGALIFTISYMRGLSKQKREEAEQANRPTADFISCQAWGMTADLLSQYCGKGSKIALEGRIQTGSYQDKETGKTVYTTDVVANRVEFLDSKSTSSQNNRVSDDDFFEDDFDDDFVDQAYNESIPF